MDRAETDYRNEMMLGKQKAREEGLKEGERAKALSTARNMLEMGLGTPEQIAQATGLTLEEVEKLAAGR